MLFASQTLEPCAPEHNDQPKLWPRRSPRLSRVGILLLMVGSTYGFCINPAEAPGALAGASQAKSESATGNRPVTVADSIGMTRLGDPQGLVAKFSPDGKRFVDVLRKGNLATNTNEYSLILFETSEVFQSPNPRVLLSMTSSSNRPAIQNVVWLNDNDTILFLGEHPGETSQLYSLQCSSKELKKLTHHPTNLTSFVVGTKGSEIVFTAENPEVSFVNEDSARTGINVTSEVLSDLIAGKQKAQLDDQTLFVQQAGSEIEDRIATEGRIFPGEMWLSPNGLYLVLWMEAPHVPDVWAEYDDSVLKAARHTKSTTVANRWIKQYELVDLRARTAHPLLDAPIPEMSSGSEVAWSPDSQSVVVSNMYLPLNVNDVAERARRKVHTYLTEINVSNQQLVKISDEDLRLVEWDANTNNVVCDVGRIDSVNGKPTLKAYLRKNKGNDRWLRSSAPQEQAKKALAVPQITVEENMNQPPRIFAVDAGTGRKSLVMDLNPQFSDLAFAKVEEIAIRTPHHNEVKAGLYWPLHYVAGTKYPLVIQTHAWTPDRFWMDGPYTTAFAAQELAAKGFFVLQIGEDDNMGPHFSFMNTPKEAPAAMTLYDNGVDSLDRKGLIDRDRVGIIGFSRTYWYVTYTLTHSKHHFAAAAVADGVDYSYFQYMTLANLDQSFSGNFDQTNGAAPFDKGLLTWLKVSPAFLMEKVETPLRIQTLDPGSLLGDWHWFTGLIRLGKPVEMMYIPDGIHELEKPWERMVSQQGDVDWFCFWLKNEEDSDPAKTQQYKRWRELQKLQEAKQPEKRSK